MLMEKELWKRFTQDTIDVILNEFYLQNIKSAGQVLQHYIKIY